MNETRGAEILLPDGSKSSEQERTERGRERAREDEKFIPVIVKRTDEALRHPDDVLENAIQEGLEQLNRPTLSLALSSVAAGLILGFSAMAVAIVTQLVEPYGSKLLVRVATAFVYPLGFVICIMSGTQLFTEHTATAVYPVLERRSNIPRLLRLWGIVIAGNIVGAFASASLLTINDGVIGAHEGYVAIGHELVGPSSTAIFLSAILAGWLMAQGAWLILATPPTISQIVCVYFVTFLIGLGGLHHSVAGSVEMFAAYMNGDEFTVGESARFISSALGGNLVGGSLFVALLNYAHIRKTQVDNGDRQVRPIADANEEEA